MTVSMYVKAVVALVASVVAALATALGNGDLGDLSTSDWVKVAIVVLGGTAATWFAENGAAAPAIKAILATATAFLAGISTAYENDGIISQGELLTAVGLALAALTAAYQLANRPAPA